MTNVWLTEVMVVTEVLVIPATFRWRVLGCDFCLANSSVTWWLVMCFGPLFRRFHLFGHLNPTISSSPCLCVLWSFFLFCLDRHGVLALGGVFLSRSGFSLSSHPWCCSLPSFASMMSLSPRVWTRRKPWHLSTRFISRREALLRAGQSPFRPASVAQFSHAVFLSEPRIRMWMLFWDPTGSVCTAHRPGHLLGPQMSIIPLWIVPSRHGGRARCCAPRLSLQPPN